MCSEVFESIHEYFKDMPDVEANCYLYLSGLEDDDDLLQLTSAEAQKKLYDMNRCCNCGTPLETLTYREFHAELEGRPFEILHEVVCPNCDLTHTNQYTFYD